MVSSTAITSASASVSALVPPPTGYVVNFAHPLRHPDLATGYWLTAVFFVLGTACLFMRLYTRIYLVKDFRIEDWLLLGSYGFGVAVQAICIRTWATASGAVHIWEISIDKLNYENALIGVSASIYCLVQWLGKASLLSFYYRMSQLRWFKHICAWLQVIQGLYTVALFFAILFPCTPISKTWDVRVQEGKCINRQALYVVLAVLNIATDIILLILPCPVVWKLQMPTAQKFAVMFLFFLGTATCVTSVVRLVLLLSFLTATDITWAVFIPGLWVNIEANLITVCCSLPALRVFMRHFMPRWMTSSISRSRTDTNGNPLSATAGGTMKEKQASRIRSKYGELDFEMEHTRNESKSGDAWTKSHCEYAGKDARRSPISYLQDETTSTESLDHFGGSGSSKRTDDDIARIEDGRIMKMETFSVVSERRVV